MSVFLEYWSTVTQQVQDKKDKPNAKKIVYMCSVYFTPHL